MFYHRSVSLSDTLSMAIQLVILETVKYILPSVTPRLFCISGIYCNFYSILFIAMIYVSQCFTMPTCPMRLEMLILTMVEWHIELYGDSYSGSL